MLFERHGREQRRLETVGAAVADDAAEASERGAPAGLVVVGKLIEVPLDQKRGAQPRDEPALAIEKGDGSLFHETGWRRRTLKCSRKRSIKGDRSAEMTPVPFYFSPLRSATTSDGFHSLPVYTLTSRPSASTIAVRRLCAMSRASVSERLIETPNRDAN